MREDHHYYFELFKSSGCGGQKKNVTLSAVKCIHLPTGIKQIRDSRDQHKNRRDGKNAVNKILDEMIIAEKLLNQNTDRSSMVGSGMRSDKIKTYRFQDGILYDHRTGKKHNLKQIMKGNVDKCWN